MPHREAWDTHDQKKGWIQEGKNLDAIEIDQLFYKKLPKNLIEQLYDNIYKTDFEMFGYEYPQEYIDMGYDE